MGKKKYLPQMEEGVFYDLQPAAVIKGKTFNHVKCEYQVPGKPNEYVVCGIPEGGHKEEDFVLIFSPTGEVEPIRSKEQTNKDEIADIKKKAKETLRDATTEQEATEGLKRLGLVGSTVTFSKPNGANQRMKMGMAYYKGKSISF